MGVRFRKSVGLGGGVKFNVSKKSVGLSAGINGAHISANSSGRRSVSAGIPGSGLYVVKSLGGSSSESDADMDMDESMECRATSTAFSASVLPVLGVILMILGAILALIMPVIGIVGIIGGVFCFRYGRKLKGQVAQDHSGAGKPMNN